MAVLERGQPFPSGLLKHRGLVECLKLQPGRACFLPVLPNQRLICWWDLNEAAPQGKLTRLLPQPGPAPRWPRLRKGAGPRLSGVMAFFLWAYLPGAPA